MQMTTASLLLGAVLLSGCGGKHINTVSAPEIETYSKEPVLVLPFRIPGRAARGIRNHEIKPGSAEFLSIRLQEELREMGIEIRVPSRQFNGQDSGKTVEPSGEPIETGSFSSQALKLGRTYEVPVVLFNTLAAYEERVGSSAGIQKPASVGFSLLLMETGTGMTLWEGRFDETQKTLFEDLFEIRSFWKRRGRWLTADELAASGLKELLKKSPWFQGSENVKEPAESGELRENLPGN